MDKTNTAGHRKLQKIIEGMGFEVVSEYRFGTYFGDLWIPQLGIVAEYDGPSHGLRGKQDAKRDAELMSSYGVVRVVRIKEEDLADPRRVEEKILSPSAAAS